MNEELDSPIVEAERIAREAAVAAALEVDRETLRQHRFDNSLVFIIVLLMGAVLVGWNWFL